MDQGKETPTMQLTEQEARRRRGRNVALALVLGALVILFWLITVVKLGADVLVRPL